MQKTCTKLARVSLLTLILLINLVATNGPIRAASSATNGPIRAASSATNGSIRAASSPAIDQLVQQVLLNIRANGWNPFAQTHNQTTGGLYINWQMDNPAVQNAGNAYNSHDPQVDLYYLTALAEYKALHPQDTTYDGDIPRILNLVTAEFANYNLPKGWIYFYLLRDGLLLHNDTLRSEAYQAASNYYTHWYDPIAGTVYNRAHGANDYNVEHTLNAGAALIDAGLSLGVPAWVQAGKSTIARTLAVALDPTYHLFYNSMTVLPGGAQVVQIYQAKPSTQGNAVEALVHAYQSTGDQSYLYAANSVLQAQFSSQLWDSTYGGLFFALDMNTGKLAAKYKETRAQTLTLIGLARYNQVMTQLGQPLLFPDKQQQLINLLNYNFYQSTYHGFFYRVTPNFQIYTSSPGQGIGYEDFFTTEAMGSAMDSLQQTEFAPGALPV